MVVENWFKDPKTQKRPEASSWIGLSDFGRALVLAAQLQSTRAPLFVVVQKKSTARNLIDNLNFLLGDSSAHKIHYLPQIEMDFLKGILPNTETIHERNASLHTLLNSPQGQIFITTGSALLQKVLTPEVFIDFTLGLSVGQEIERDELCGLLSQAGYSKHPVAYDPGTFAVRGGIIDIFSPSQEFPVRIEFFGDTVESIRYFDPKTQRSMGKIDNSEFIPVAATILPRAEAYEKASMLIKERLDDQGVAKVERESLLLKVQEGDLTGVMHFLFPLLSQGSSSVFEYLTEDTQVWCEGQESLIENLEQVDLHYFEKNYSLFFKEKTPVAQFDDLFCSVDEVLGQLKKKEVSYFKLFQTQGEVAHTLEFDALHFQREREEAKRKGNSQHALEPFVEKFRQWIGQQTPVHLVCHSQMHAERMQLLFENYGLKSQIMVSGEPFYPQFLNAPYQMLHLWKGEVTESLHLTQLGAVVLSEDEIFGTKKRKVKAAHWQGGEEKTLKSFRQMKEGDYIVHRDHGIGKYLGLESREFGGVANDYVAIEYRDGDKLYIPVYRLNVIQKYVGGESGNPLLDKLGGERWDKVKKKVLKATQELAAELLDIQAKRKLLQAPAFSVHSEELQQFEMEFPFDETPDQLKAISSIQGDLSTPTPMDRLVVGDVGYGKTEVAMRATYQCVLGKGQVAVLVPTTVLAFQHHESFRKRFEGTGVQVEMVCRLKTSAEIKAILARLKQGKVDVLVGTHRLLSSDVEFKNLGLVVIDEEHRFGVTHKEKLRKLASQTHVLTLTATPIPRTLNMAMAGIKEISLITTPPPDRLSVRTFVCRKSKEVIREAISNELKRKGQVFFLHNRVQSIHRIADEIREMFPQIRLQVAHGQMDGKTLEEKMLGFYRGDYDVLLCTTIIESGLDVPNANTMIIDEAHQLGLAQLYQIRGRVGRSDKRAYCYLLAPPESSLSQDAKQRLQVIQRYSDLGAGFQIASHDMEIRGAGDLLGKEQSGNVHAVGLDMYFDLLEKSIEHMKGNVEKVEIEPEIHLKIPSYFPQQYLNDVGERVNFYRRLSACETEESILEVEQEIQDRLGKPPEEVNNLLGMMMLKLHLKPLHVTHMKCGPKKTSLQFASSTPVEPEKMIRLVSQKSSPYALTPDGKLVFEPDKTTWQGQLKEIKLLRTKLGI